MGLEFPEGEHRARALAHMKVARVEYRDARKALRRGDCLMAFHHGVEAELSMQAAMVHAWAAGPSVRRILRLTRRGGILVKIHAHRDAVAARCLRR